MHLIYLFIKLNKKNQFFINFSHPEDEPPLLVRNIDQKKPNAMNLKDGLHNYEDRRNLKDKTKLYYIK